MDRPNNDLPGGPSAGPAGVLSFKTTGCPAVPTRVPRRWIRNSSVPRTQTNDSFAADSPKQTCLLDEHRSGTVALRVLPSQIPIHLPLLGARSFAVLERNHQLAWMSYDNLACNTAICTPDTPQMLNNSTRFCTQLPHGPILLHARIQPCWFRMVLQVGAGLDLFPPPHLQFDGV